LINKQKGVVPLYILIALLSGIIGGYAGFSLGGGTFFSFGIGVATVFLLYPFVKKIYKKISQPSQSNDQ